MKNIKNFGKATAIFLILAVALNMNVSADVCMCDSCASCTEKLNDIVCDEVKLTQNVVGTIDFPSSNKVFDCQGFQINGGHVQYGIRMSGKQNNTIKNCVMFDFNSAGVYLFSSSNNSIINNSVSDAGVGVFLEINSNNNKISNNFVFSNFWYQVYLDDSSINNLMYLNKMCDTNPIGVADVGVNTINNIGDSNTCDTTIGWNDNSGVGCMFSCVGMKVVIPPKMFDPPIAPPVCYPNTSQILANITIVYPNMNAYILSNVSVCLNVTYNSNLVYYEMKFVDFRGTGNALIPFDFTGGVGVYEVITEVNCLRNIKEDNYFDNFEGGSFEVKDCSVSSQVSPPNIPKSTQIPLKVGWNLISLPLNPINNSLSDVLKSINGKYSDVYTMRNGDWDYRVFAYSSWFGGLTTIDYGKGYWIKMNVESNLTIFGTEVENTAISLHDGWNLIGSVDCDINSLKSNYPSITDIYSYDMDWIYQSRYYNSWFGTLNILLKNQGYWIKTNQKIEVVC